MSTDKPQPEDEYEKLLSRSEPVDWKSLETLKAFDTSYLAWKPTKPGKIPEPTYTITTASGAITAAHLNDPKQEEIDKLKLTLEARDKEVAELKQRLQHEEVQLEEFQVITTSEMITDDHDYRKTEPEDLEIVLRDLKEKITDLERRVERNPIYVHAKLSWESVWDTCIKLGMSPKLGKSGKNAVERFIKHLCREKEQKEREISQLKTINQDLESALEIEREMLKAERNARTERNAS